MDKSNIKKLYYSIGEVSKITDLKPYVLRYWETEFKGLNPPKNRAGNRTYRQKDIDLILQIKDLLYNRKFTIDGARTQIASGEQLPLNEVVEPVRTEVGNSEELNKKIEIFRQIKEELAAILDIIHD